MDGFLAVIIEKIWQGCLSLHKKSLLVRLKNKLGALGSVESLGLAFDGYGLENIFIGNRVKFGNRLKLRTFSRWGDKSYSPQVVIGNDVNIESDCHISAINSVIIEDNVLIASFVYISDHSHGEIKADELDVPPLQRPLYSKGPILICRNAWIGEKCTILPNVTIGEGAIIGANSVVTKDIPPYSVACGVPARVIKQLRK